MEPTTLNEMLNQQVRNHPDRLCYRAQHGTWTFKQVDDATNRLAQGLAKLRIGAGDRVACLTKHVVECSLLSFAANKVGAVCSPVNWRLAAPEVEYILQNAEARFVMADAEFLPMLAGLDLPGVKLVVATLEAPGATSLEQWAARFDARDSGYRPNPQDAALQLYSSGTTGHPKGVELTHTNLVNGCLSGAKEYGYGVGTVMLSVAPPFHIGGMGLSIISACNGCTLVTYPEFNPAQVVAAFGEHRITDTFLVPAMIHMLLQVPGVEQADFSSMRLLGYGASPITEQVLTDALRVFKCKFSQFYGLTETTGTVVALAAEDHDPQGPKAYLLRAAGKPRPGSAIRIVDLATGKDLPDGEVGEVWIHSPQNMKGYWRNDAANRDAFPEGREDGIGWFRSGDAGYIREGYLFIQDRIKDMIISGGENIYPIEVENVLTKHPAVLDCAVIAVPHERWGETVKACVVLRPGASVSEQELIDFARANLAHFKCPRSVDFMDTLPRNPSGKLLKKMLREPYWKDAKRSVN